MTDEIQSSSADSLCNRFVCDNVKEKKLNNISNYCVINNYSEKMTTVIILKTLAIIHRSNL